MRLYDGISFISPEYGKRRLKEGDINNQTWYSIPDDAPQLGPYSKAEVTLFFQSGVWVPLDQPAVPAQSEKITIIDDAHEMCTVWYNDPLYCIVVRHRDFWANRMLRVNAYKALMSGCWLRVAETETKTP